MPNSMARAWLFVALAGCAAFAACGGSTGSVAGADAGAPSGEPDAGVPGAEAGVPDGSTPGPGPADCTACIMASLSWGQNGGLVEFVDTSALAPCRTFTRTRSGHVVDGGPSSCSTELGDCSAASVAIGDVEAALADPDVTAALGAPKTPVYGVDSRAVDGAVFRITAAGKSIDVGSDCAAGAKNCVPVPAGVSALQHVLQALDTQEVAKPACAQFPKP